MRALPWHRRQLPHAAMGLDVTVVIIAGPSLSTLHNKFYFVFINGKS